MKIIKKIMWFFFILIVGVVIAAVVVPTIYKDEIVEKLKITLNNQLNAEVDFEDVGLSIISTFPNAGLTIQNLSIEGVEDFEGINLFKSKNTTVEVSIPSLINDDIPYQIKEVNISEADINIVRLPDGTGNYLITKTDTTGAAGASYIIDLDYYEIKDSKLTYTDKLSDLKMSLEDVNHTGSGRFTESVFDLDTYTTSSKFNVTSAGATYVKNAKAQLDAIINIDLDNEKYTLKQNKLTLNELNLEGEGFVQLAGDDIIIDATIKGLEDNFRSYLSVIPSAYVDNLKNVATNGSGSFTSTIKGRYNSETTTYPAIDAKLNITDGYVLYNNMPKAIENINTNIHISATDGNYDNLKVNIPTITANVGDDPLSASLVVSESTKNPSVDGQLKADVNLRNWKSAIPGEMIDDMEGLFKADMKFAGSVADIQAANYDAITFAGEVEANGVQVKRTGQPNLKINSAVVKASPAKLDIDAQQIIYGESDFDIKGHIENPLLLSINSGGTIKSNLDIKSKVINVDELMTEPEDKATANTTTNTSTSLDAIDKSKSSIQMKAHADKIIYDGKTYNNVNVDGRYAGDAIQINAADALMLDNDINITGRLENILGYLAGDEMLKGNIDLQSNKLDLNQIMSTNSESGATEENFIVPANMDIDIIADIKDLTYTNLNFKNSKSTLKVADQIANITDMVTNTLGGEIGLQGMYDSNAEKPSFNLKMDLSKIRFVDAFNQVTTIKTLAPIMKYMDGFFNSTLVFSGSLNDGMVPDFSTLDASGFIETFSSTIRDLDVLDKLGDKLGIDALKSINLENTKNWFDVVDGTVELKPRDFKVEDIEMTVAGKQNYSQVIDYIISMKVPREKLKSNAITGILDQGLTKIEAEAAKLGINLGKGDFINLEIGMTGTFTNPKFSIKPVGYEAGTVKGVIEDEINNQIDKAKDSIKTVIEDTKNTVRDTVNKVVTTAVDSAKTVVKDKVNTAVDSAKNVAKDKIDSLAKQNGLDSIGTKVKDILGENAEKEKDKIKDKIKDWNPFKKKPDGN